jgi:hypothetical protein
VRLAGRCVLVPLIAYLALPAPVLAHGGDEMEAEALAEQPARILAQQAIAELKVRRGHEGGRRPPRRHRGEQGQERHRHPHAPGGHGAA